MLGDVAEQLRAKMAESLEMVDDFTTKNGKSI